MPDIRDAHRAAQPAGASLRRSPGRRLPARRRAVVLVALLAMAATGCVSGAPGRSAASPRPSGPADGPSGASAVTPAPRPEGQAAPDPRFGRGAPADAPAAAPAAAVPAQAPPPAPAAPADPPALSTTPQRVSDALVRGTAGTGRKVALTFDDGPSAEWTPQVLALLDEYGAKATFCVVGEQAREHPDLLRRIVAKGHRLCDHSENHDERIARQPEQALRAQIEGARDAVHAALPGVEIPWFRAPGGSWSTLIRTTAAAYGMKPLDWSVDSRDWERRGVDAIVANVRRDLKPGGVVLMHDAGGDRSQTIGALRKLLPWLVAQGYTFDFPR